MKKTCRIPNCDKPMAAREMCMGHYQRWYRNNNVSIAEMLEPLVHRPGHGLPASLRKQLAR
jgi:hypothetical protein